MKKALLTFMCLMASSSFADTEKAKGFEYTAVLVTKDDEVWLGPLAC